jgi:hypothetical protein
MVHLAQVCACPTSHLPALWCGPSPAALVANGPRLQLRQGPRRHNPCYYPLPTRTAICGRCPARALLFEQAIPASCHPQCYVGAPPYVSENVAGSAPGPISPFGRGPNAPHPYSGPRLLGWSPGRPSTGAAPAPSYQEVHWLVASPNAMHPALYQLSLGRGAPLLVSNETWEAGRLHTRSRPGLLCMCCSSPQARPNSGRVIAVPPSPAANTLTLLCTSRAISLGCAAAPGPAAPRGRLLFLQAALVASCAGERRPRPGQSLAARPLPPRAEPSGHHRFAGGRACASAAPAPNPRMRRAPCAHRRCPQGACKSGAGTCNASARPRPFAMVGGRRPYLTSRIMQPYSSKVHSYRDAPTLFYPCYIFPTHPSNRPSLQHACGWDCALRCALIPLLTYSTQPPSRPHPPPLQPRHTPAPGCGRHAGALRCQARTSLPCWPPAPCYSTRPHQPHRHGNTFAPPPECALICAWLFATTCYVLHIPTCAPMPPPSHCEQARFTIPHARAQTRSARRLLPPVARARAAGHGAPPAAPAAAAPTPSPSRTHPVNNTHCARPPLSLRSPFT